MNDKVLIEIIAQIWVNNGGDSDGIEWCKDKLKERIRQLIEERSKGNE